MSKLFRFLPAILLAMYVVFKLSPYVQAPETSGYEPTSSQKEILIDVSDALKGYPDAASDFESLYHGMALVVGSDEVVLRTTGDVRKAHENAGAIAIQANEIPRIPGYAEAVNEFIAAEVGNDNVPLSPEKRKQLIDTFKALGWATSQ